MDFDVFKLNAQIEETHWWFTGRRRIISGLVKEVMQPGRERLVVDVGCGTGANIAALADDYCVVGIDVTQQAVGLARERFPGVTFHCTEAIPFLQGLGNRDDVVILLNDVLEHVEHAYDFFSDVIRVAPAGAHFVITVPANPLLWSPHDVSHGHFRRYTVETLRAHWMEHDVREIMVSHFNARLYPLIRILRALTNCLGRSFGSAHTDLSVPPGWLNTFLRSIFAGELSRLKGVLGGQAESYRHGVSLVAVLVKPAGV